MVSNNCSGNNTGSISFQTVLSGRAADKKYGSEFEERYKDNGYCESIDYLKVFKYRDESVDISYLDNKKLKNRLNNLGEDYALVLYVEDNHSFAELYVFHDEGGRWVLSEWNTIWSYSGSADGFMWPYYP